MAGNTRTVPGLTGLTGFPLGFNDRRSQSAIVNDQAMLRTGMLNHFKWGLAVILQIKPAPVS